MSRLLVGVTLLVFGAALAAQGKREPPPLGAIAKATQEEKKPAAKSEKPPSKKYSNEDLGGESSTSDPIRYSPNATSSSGDRGKDETYWRGKVVPIRQKLHETTDRLNLLKARLEGLKTEGIDIAFANGRTSPAQSERQRLNAQILDLEATRRRYEQSLKDVEEQGRRAGALPGWFR